MAPHRFSIKERLKSFAYAFSGLKVLVKEEHNARVHLAAMCGASAAGFVLKISAHEWIAVAFAIGLVISLEAVNSAIENIADFVSPQQHDDIKKIKDLSAAAVLIGAITAAVIGLMVFAPKLWALV